MLRNSVLFERHRNRWRWCVLRESCPKGQERPRPDETRDDSVLRFLVHALSLLHAYYSPRRLIAQV